jgi:hypothetical protein
MMDKNVGQPGEDSAWISMDLPFPSGEVYEFIQKIELLFRLNPHLEIKSWQEEAPGKIYHGKQIYLDSLNEMNGLQPSRTLSVSDVQPDVSFCLSYDSGLKQATIFSVQNLGPASSRLVVKELYPAGMSAAEREARLNEVDRSLVPWGAAMHNYFIHQSRWGWLPFFNWWQNTFWLGMMPRHRRIARMIIWTTVLEFVVFLFVFVIYWLELGSGHIE